MNERDKERMKNPAWIKDQKEQKAQAIASAEKAVKTAEAQLAEAKKNLATAKKENS